MAWSEQLAAEFKRRNNPRIPQYLIGTVVSAQPLKVSVYDGSVILQGDQLKRVDPWLQCTAYRGCTPKTGATCDWSGGKVLQNCAGCDQGRCIELRPLEVGQEVALVGDQTYILLGVVA